MDLTYTIVQKIADRTETDPLDLPPLFDTIDPDVLQDLVKSSEEATTTIRFDYCSYDVQVSGNGNINVEDRTGR